MDKMKFETPDLTSENIEKIAALFPNLSLIHISEGLQCVVQTAR